MKLLGRYYGGEYVTDLLREAYGCYPCLSVKRERGGSLGVR